jgi:hypothetical protein
VTLTRTRVPEHRAVHWLEFPFVATIFQRQDEDARDRSARLAIRPRPNERSQGSAPGSDDELSQAAHGIRHSVGVLWSEALITMVVGRDDNVCVEFEQGLPEFTRIGVVPLFSRAEQRSMPVRDGAARAACAPGSCGQRASRVPVSYERGRVIYQSSRRC